MDIRIFDGLYSSVTEVFSGLQFSAGSLVNILVTCLLLLAVPVLFWLFWQLKHKGQLKFWYLPVGAAGFIVSVRVLELGVHMFCIVLDNPVSRFINGNDIAYILYGICMAGIFEECGRYIVFRFILKKYRTRENAVLYGIGHGGIEVLVVALPLYILYLVIAVLFLSMDLPAVLKVLNITESSLAAALPTIRAVASFRIWDGASGVLERILCMFVHIGLTVIVFYSVQSGKKRFLLLAVLLHMAVDVLPAMYQRGLVSVWITEGWILVCAAVITVIAVNLYRKSAPVSVPDPEGPPAETAEE